MSVKSIKFLEVVAISQLAFGVAYRELIIKKVEEELAKKLARDAADAFGNALLRDLAENGIEVKS